MPPQRPPRFVFALVIAASGCSAEDVLAPIVQRVAELEADGDEVVYLRVVLEPEPGEFSDPDEVGTLDNHAFQRVGRPWSYFNEAWIYDEQAWSLPDEDGSVEHGYVVTRRPNPVGLPTPVGPSGPPVVLPDVLAEVLASPNDATQIRLNLKLAAYPESNLPLRPRAGTLADPQEAAALAAYDEAVADRAALYEDKVDDLEDWVLGLGGVVLKRTPSTGWLAVDVPVSAVAGLSTRLDVARITSAHGSPQSLGLWSQGNGRGASRLDVDRFHADGFDGGDGGDGNGNVFIAVLEAGRLEDEACAFMDANNCNTSRIIRKFQCDDPSSNGDYCEIISNFADDDGAADGHATSVAAAALGDYEDDQGCGYELGDPNWGGTCHNNGWEYQATSPAPEAKLYFWGQVDATDVLLAREDQVEEATSYAVDVINNSWGDNSAASVCKIEPAYAFEEEVENAFDAGILVVSGAGNEDGPSQTDCNVYSPADIVKSLAVNAYNARTDDCYNDPADWCLVDQSESALGGADAKFGSFTFADQISIIDLVAPNAYSHGTLPDGPVGEVMEGLLFTGTSVATPLVSGMAAIVTEWYRSFGSTWISSPGRLHTVMLAMGNRRYSGDPDNTSVSTSTLATGADNLYGLGHVRLRYLSSNGDLGPWANSMRTLSFTSSSSTKAYWPFGQSPIPPDAALLKCVLMQDEDMSSKSDVSNVDLKISLYTATSGTCGSLDHTVTDSSLDTKSMVSTLDAADRCLKVEVIPVGITSQGITTHTMCYYAGETEDE